MVGIFAGALAEKILQSDNFENKNDSTQCVIELWNASKGNLRQYMEKASHIHRLRKHNMDDVFEYTFMLDTCKVVPCVQQNKIVNGY